MLYTRECTHTHTYTKHIWQSNTPTWPLPMDKHSSRCLLIFALCFVFINCKFDQIKFNFIFRTQIDPIAIDFSFNLNLIHLWTSTAAKSHRTTPNAFLHSRLCCFVLVRSIVATFRVELTQIKTNVKSFIDYETSATKPILSEQVERCSIHLS